MSPIAKLLRGLRIRPRDADLLLIGMRAVAESANADRLHQSPATSASRDSFANAFEAGGCCVADCVVACDRMAAAFSCAIASSISLLSEYLKLTRFRAFASRSS